MKQINLPQTARTDGPSDRPNRLALFVIGLLLFAIVSGALTWVAVQIWLEVLSSI